MNNKKIVKNLKVKIENMEDKSDFLKVQSLLLTNREEGEISKKTFNELMDRARVVNKKNDLKNDFFDDLKAEHICEEIKEKARKAKEKRDECKSEYAKKREKIYEMKREEVVENRALSEIQEENKEKTQNKKEKFYKHKDKELVENGGFIPFHIYWKKIKFNKSFTKTMFNTYTTLAIFADYNGEIKGISIKKIADFLNKKSQTRILKAINELEKQRFIKVDRNRYGFEYKILGFEKAYTKRSKGGFFVNKNILLKLNKFNLKHFRLSFYLMALRHHMPNNKNKKPITQEILKNVSNSVSFKELNEIIKDLTGVLFKRVNNFKTKVNKIRKKYKTLEFFFYRYKLGIFENYFSDKSKKKIKSNSMYETVKDILKNFDFKISWINLMKLIRNFKNITKNTLKEIKGYSYQRKQQGIKQPYSINYIIKLAKYWDNALKGKIDLGEDKYLEMV